jgi:polygalacturonase
MKEDHGARALAVLILATLLLPLLAARAAAQPPVPDRGVSVYEVRSFGAQGDGRTIDTEAINAAIEAAAAAGGGTVRLAAGTYPSFSIRLQSNVSLYLDAGATLLAADPSHANGRYDAPEPNEWDLYQDFGHSHWQNSLIWGIGLENVSIVGQGLIDGRALTRRGPGARWSKGIGGRPLSMGPEPPAAGDPEAAELAAMDGLGNKAISLKLCRNVLLRDFQVSNGGHFAVLATGVDDLTIDNLKLDTNRDGLDIDACRNVRISNTAVNSPNDDAIVLKSSYALGYLRATENVVIVNCQVTGYDLGTLLSGSHGRTHEQAPDRDGPTGRIKLGTESNGGFRNITISNCVFDRSRGLAIETVDGGAVEGVTVTNLAMRDVTSAPIFLRLGSRGRGPGGPPPGRLRGISISNVVAEGADPRYASIIAGIPGHPVEDIWLSNVRIIYRGGGTKSDAAVDPPENEGAYPEPSMFGTLPAYGFFIRHARGVALRDVSVGFERHEGRPPFVLRDVRDVHLGHVRAQRPDSAPFCVLRDVRRLLLRDSPDSGGRFMKRADRDVIRWDDAGDAARPLAPLPEQPAVPSTPPERR